MNQNNIATKPANRALSVPNVSSKTRSAAIRAQRRNLDDANKIVSRYADATRREHTPAHHIANQTGKLKLTFLGGLEGVGEKNMAVFEYLDQAIVLDCGNNLGVDLPGINYEINDTAYLESIRHKIRAYVITHGHLDHIGGLRHIVPRYPAPIYGSRYTIGVIARSFSDEVSDFVPNLITVNIDGHERLKIGDFTIEFIRVTHAIPDPAAICIDTPVGRILATGDFRLDPEPLDNLPSDTDRLKQLGNEGVLLLMSDSSYADAEGRTPTEHTLQGSFHDVIANAGGRIFVAVFSSNINRTQMIINAAVAAGRHVVLDGRSMLGYIEIAVRQGILKVPKGTILSMNQANSVPDNNLLVMCTGGQGEPHAALQRMSEGEHSHITLKKGDTVVISSSPIPGNEVRYDQISNRLDQKGVTLFRHPTHILDGCGPLHVSGHARRDELREMVQMVRPSFFIPVHAGALRRRYHAELGIQENILRQNVLLPNNGDSLFFSKDTVEYGGQVPHGSLLIDQTGSIVSNIVVKDRLMLSEDGFLAVLLSVHGETGQLLANPDIISRGFIPMRDSEELMRQFRAELRRAVRQRFKRVDLDRFKAETKDFIAQFLFRHTGRSPTILPVITVFSGSIKTVPAASRKYSPAGIGIAADQKRFHEMRTNLLGQSRKLP